MLVVAAKDVLDRCYRDRRLSDMQAGKAGTRVRSLRLLYDLKDQMEKRSQWTARLHHNASVEDVDYQ